MIIKTSLTYSYLPNTSLGRENSQGWEKVENQGLDNTQGWEGERNQGQDSSQVLTEVKNQGWDML